MDGEQVRAIGCLIVWAGMTSAERKAMKSPAALLPLVQDMLARSYALGSPTSGENPDVVLVDVTPFSAVRFREWLSRQTAEVQSLYAVPTTP